MNPQDLHYTMPAEWARHERTFISWPVQESMVHPDNHESVSAGYAEIIQAIAEFEPVSVVVNPDDMDTVEKLNLGANVTLLPILHNDAWLRDNGPTFVVGEDGSLAGVNWKFNAWGGKYSPWDLDDAVAPQILELHRTARMDAPLVMEGGSIHSDGEGTLLTTEECLLNPNRNPELSREEIAGYVQQYTGTESVIWLKRGLSGDETDGHVDNIACFAAPGKVIIQVCEDPQDENYAITWENLSILEQAVDAKGRRLEIIKIQQPPRVDAEDSRLTLSYLNFYFVNGGIILPVFGGTAAETDKLAEETLAGLFPDRRIRTVNGMAVIGEGGNVHCTTQQMPAVK
ncbi:agmatine deiminase family protein [Paenibacillus sp. MMS20-IR301]|uniref:agmatine deiminase family protein n=1 Tax=Paenibacillus sp. MMS20-IR301 TaxID=2895946 RepID=UPI0028EA8B5B|nr:agmatine deiminase family protein [Paenibacillus sp. MMS20-IR301]WNS41893.1 agmatine deiminase family protein [Paenibacillus sp. MMS20-IR301]